MHPLVGLFWLLQSSCIGLECLEIRDGSNKLVVTQVRFVLCTPLGHVNGEWHAHVH